MFEIRKEIVNSIGNVQHSEHIRFVNCDNEEQFNALTDTYYYLAKANGLYYKLRGQPYIVRYVFIYYGVLTAESAIDIANANIKAHVAEANDYIKSANTAYKKSNKRRGISDDSMLLKPIDVKDFMWGGKSVDKDRYVKVVQE